MVLAVEPIRTTLGYGQVNTMLMALVVADLLPDRPPGRSSDHGSGAQRRRIPSGSLIGFASAIKLTPALFVVFAFLIGRRRTAITAIISFAIFTGIGAVLLPRQTWVFFGGLSGGNTRTASPLYTGNQSLLGVFFRLGGSGLVTTLAGLAVAGIVALLGTLVAAHWWRQNQKAFAVAVVGLTTCLASPLSWTHHYVWILPFAAALFSAGLPRWVRWLGGFWVIWVCICLPLAVLPYGGAAGAPVRRRAAVGGQPRTRPRRRPDRRPGLEPGHHHPSRHRCHRAPLACPPAASDVTSELALYAGGNLRTAPRSGVQCRPRQSGPTVGWTRLPAMTTDGIDIKPRSRVVTDGLEATGSRGMLRAVGMGDDDWDKPQIGVASSWNEITPCNLSLDRLAKAVKDGVHAAGGYPLEFGTISVSDGISMGHEGMHFSLVSREIIADSVETVMSAERLDGSVLLAGCDKSLPGMLMAAARLDLASVFLYAGSIMPGRVGDKDVTIIDAFEAVGACVRGLISREQVPRSRRRSVPARAPAAGCTPPTPWPALPRHSACRCRAPRLRPPLTGAGTATPGAAGWRRSRCCAAASPPGRS